MPTNPDEENVVKMLQTQLTGRVDNRSLLFPKVFGGRYCDRDLEIFLFIRSNGSGVWKSDPWVNNACICIEVKGHREVTFDQSTRISVETKGKLVYPVEQARESSQEMKIMLKRHDVSRVFYFACFPNSSLSSESPHDVLSIKKHVQFPFVLFRDEIVLETILDKLRLQWRSINKSGKVRSINDDITALSLSHELPNILSGVKQKLVVGRFDRNRFERISNANIHIREYLGALDDGDIVLKGKAGSGKSVCGIKLAHAYSNRGNRVLMCTYNVALARDLERLHRYYLEKNEHVLSLDVYEQVSVDIDTIDHIIFKYAGNARPYLGGSSATEEASSDFNSQKAAWRTDLRNLIQMIGAEDVRDAFDAYYQLVVIDEAQDIEEEDYVLLKTLFGHATRFAFIHSPDQKLRDLESNCVNGVAASEFNRNTVYRNFRKIAKYAGRVQRRLGRHIIGNAPSIEPDTDSIDDVYAELTDGTVGIHLGSADGIVPIVQKFLEESFAAGYDQWSTMVVVPGHDECQQVIAALSKAGIQCWDGLDRDIRSEEYCPDHVRVIDYRSCRGLEAYNVVVFDPAKAIEREFVATAKDIKSATLAANHIYVAVSRAICNLAIVMPDQRYRDVFEKCLVDL